MLKVLIILSALAIATSDASVFLERMVAFLPDTTLVGLEEVWLWQIAGLIIPVLAGPVYVACYLLWNTDQNG